METVQLNKQEIKLLQSCTSKDASRPTLRWVHFSTFGLAYSTDGFKAAAVPICSLEQSFSLNGSDLISGANEASYDHVGYAS